MNKNLLQKLIFSFAKRNFCTKTLAMLLFFTVLSVTKTQAQNFAWAKSMGSTANDSSRSIAVDAAGNVYTTGFFAGTVDFDPNAGVSNLTAAGGEDIFVIKLDATGNLVWAKAVGGVTGSDRGYGISVDAAGNVYTTGFFAGTVDFDPNAGVSNLISVSGSSDIFVSKLDTNGNLIWAKAMGGTSGDIGFGISVDAAGNVYTTGQFQGTVDFDPNAGVSNLTAVGSNDIFVSKLDATGNLIWAKAMGGTSSDSGNGIAVDAAGNVYTTGNFAGTADFNPNAGVSNLTSAGSTDIFVSKLDTTGNLVWAKAMGGTTADVGYAMSTDTVGNVYTTGNFAGTADFDPNAGVSNITAAGGNDIFVSKLDTAGNLVWAKAMGSSTANDIGLGISSDAAGNIYTTGNFGGTADFDPNIGVSNITVAGSIDIFVSKLDTAGNLVWAKAMGGTSFDVGYAISTDAAGNVYTTGYFQGTGDFDPNAGVYNLTSVGAQDIFVHKMSPTQGAGIDFDGVDDYVNCGNSASLNVTGSLSVEALVYRSLLNTDDCIIGKDIYTTSTGYSFWVYQNNKLVFRFGNREYYSTNTISQNTWTHVAATFEAGVVNLYINGVLDATYTSIAPPVTNTNGLYLGTPQDAIGNNTYAFSGKIDEIRIWNRGLIQAEIANNMNCELSATQTGLLAYYQFNQGIDSANNSTITTLTDASGNANTGTLNNFTLTGTTSNWTAPGGVTTGNTCSPFLSTSDFEYSSKLTVYPNPSSDIFTINTDSRGTIVVYDLIGKIIKSENIDLGITKLDLSNYPRGLYLMKVTNDNNQTKTMKLIKQ